EDSQGEAQQEDRELVAAPAKRPPSGGLFLFVLQALAHEFLALVAFLVARLLVAGRHLVLLRRHLGVVALEARAHEGLALVALLLARLLIARLHALLLLLLRGARLLLVLRVGGKGEDGEAKNQGFHLGVSRSFSMAAM